MRDARDDELDRLKRALGRERGAREEAEALLERKSLELYRSAETLRMQIERARALHEAADAAADGIALTDPDGIFTYMNPSHAALFGYRVEELIGQPWQALYDDAAAERIMREAMPDVFGLGSWLGEAVGRAKDGAPVEQDVALTARPDGSGIICITRDASARKRREERVRNLEHQLRTSEKSIAQYVLSNAVAHDLGNLIAVIDGNLSALEETVFGAEREDRIGRIRTATDQARDIVSSLESGVDSTLREKHEVDLVALLKTNLELIESIRPAGIAIAADLPAQATARVNDTLLSRSILNIAKNAFEVMGDSGRFSLVLARGVRTEGAQVSARLGAECPDPAWVIELSDEGPGFPTGDFETFLAPYASTKATTFSGLGLLSVRALAESRSATVEIINKPARGVTFRILLPRPGKAPSVHSAAPGLAGERSRILVVEDEAAIGEDIARRLEQHGYHATHLSDPLLARDVLLSGAGVDLAITDLNMPGLSGDALAREVRSRHPALPFILVSGRAGFLADSQLFAASFSKPIAYSELLAAVDRTLGARRHGSH